MPNARRYFIGDGCIAWSWGDAIDLAVSRRVLDVYRRLKQHPRAAATGILDVVPAYHTLAVHFDPGTTDPAAIEALVVGVVESVSTGAQAAGKTVLLPVRYDGEDLERVAAHSRLPVAEVIQRHAAGTYTVAMIGFLPHFPYLIGLDPQLATPRLDSPRTAVPKGAVGIGGAQTGVYPSQSPGGWNIIGYTDPDLLTVIAPGDTIRFERIQNDDV